MFGHVASHNTRGKEQGRSMRRHGYGISVFGAIVLCCLFFCFPAQSDDNAVSIRVGYYEDGDYMSRSRSAEYIGFNIEFLQKLAKVGGMRYEMLDEGSWENAWHQLLEGHIDMIPAVFRTEEREKEVLFSNLPMGTLYVTLNVRVDDKRYGYEDFSSFQGMRVGIIRGSSDGERFQRYCEKFGVKPIIVPYAETQALLSALEDGTLDGVAITHLGRSSTFRSVAQFSPEPVYIAVAKNRPDLLARLDAAMNAIVLRDPNYMMRLYDKYFAVSMAQQPVFTKEEEAFLKQADVGVAAYDPSWAPLGADTERDVLRRHIGSAVHFFKIHRVAFPF
ncbi:MAG: substrate-binding periplasmic protein [Bilophila wadsworthia]